MILKVQKQANSTQLQMHIPMLKLKVKQSSCYTRSQHGSYLQGGEGWHCGWGCM